jgi:hypothetical protein
MKTGGLKLALKGKFRRILQADVISLAREGNPKTEQKRI